MEKDYFGDDQWFESNKKNLNILPIMLLVILVPVAMRLVILNISDYLYKYWDGSRVYGDVFSYVKMILTLILTLILLISFIFKYSQGGFKLIGDNRYNKYILIYSILVILSTVFSDYKEISFSGFLGKQESIWILLSYMIILFTVIQLVQNSNDAKLIIWSISSGGFIVGMVGISQIFKHDFWKTYIGQSILLSSRYKELLIDGFSITMAEGTAYGTLNNTNYMGSYVLLVIPLTMSLFLITKKKLAKFFVGIIFGIMILNLFGSNSRAGIVGFALMILTFLLVIGRRLFKECKKMVFGLLIAIILVAIGSYFILPDNINPIKRLTSEIILTNSKYQEPWLKSIEIIDNKAIISTLDNKFIIDYNDGDIKFIDSEGQYLTEFFTEDNKIGFNNEKYSNYNAFITKTENELLLLVISINNLNFALETEGSINFYFDITDGEFTLSDSKGNHLPAIKAESIGFKKKETLGSSRGYIWSRTLPIIKENLFLGTGPDTYAAVFPQYDLQGKIIAYGNPNKLVDKPHNYFLEIASNTGIPSLIAILCILSTYLLSCIKAYKNINYKNNYYVISLGAFLAIVGYLGAALFNDSIIAIAPVFWVILGIGIAMNYKINKGMLEEW